MPSRKNNRQAVSREVEAASTVAATVLPPPVVGYASDYGSSWTPAWYDTRLGGVPAMPCDVSFPSRPVCQVCGKYLSLVLQAFSPTGAHKDRALLIFGCNSMRCAESEAAWTVYRVARRINDGAEMDPESPDKDEELVSETKTGHGNSDVSSGNETETGGDSQSEGELDMMNSLLEIRKIRLEERTDFLSKNDKKRGRKSQESGDASLRGYSKILSNSDKFKEKSDCGVKYPRLPVVPIEVDYEVSPTAMQWDPLKSDVERLYSAYTAAQAQKERGGAGGSNASTSDSHWAPETEEVEDKGRIALSDFQAYLEQMPGHLIRYQRLGKPIWPTHPPPPPPTSCPCGSERVFEVQLMPTCLYYLRVDENTSEGQEEAGMAWLTVAVYTCKADCDLRREDEKNDDFLVAQETLHVLPDEF